MEETTPAIEGEERAYDESRKPAELVRALHLAPGQRVADIGAAGGYLTFRLVAAVGPTGHVVATEVSDSSLAVLSARARGTPNLEVRKVSPDEPGLESGAYDFVLMAEVDHYLKDRAGYLTRLCAAFAPDGRLAVTHVRSPELKDPLMRAAEQAGYRVIEEFDGLPTDYLLIFKPPSPCPQ